MHTAENKQRSLDAASQFTLTALSVLGTILILAWLYHYSTHGIDFTDESFYLTWISNPFLYDSSVTQFGFLYHPIYLLLDGDIASLRRINILTTYFLAWVFSLTFLRSLAPESTTAKSTALQVAAAGLATNSLISFASWLPTPSYNSLALQSLLITSTGLILAEKSSSPRSVLGWIIIGVGGWLAFLAKPSTAFALAVTTPLYLLASRKWSARLLLLAVGSTLALLLLSAVLIDGSISAFLTRLINGMKLAEYLGGGHTFNHMLRIDELVLSRDSQTQIFVIGVFSFLATYCISGKKTIQILAGTLACFLLSAITALHVFGTPFGFPSQKPPFSPLTFGLVLAALLSTLALGGTRALRQLSAPQWAITCLFIAMPHVYAFGSNINYWRVGSAASIFWLFAGITLLAPLARGRSTWLFLLPIVLATQVVTTTLIRTGLERPYRQPSPLTLNDTAVEFGPHRTPLILSAAYASYINNMTTIAQKAGFQIGTPMVDLTGQSPGVLYALGAESVGQAWTIGGYPGSLNLAKAALSGTACEKIAAAWVLLEPDGPRSIPSELMRGLGAAFPQDYLQVGMWETAEGAGGYRNSRTQILYKPKAMDETYRACQAQRQGN